MNPFRCLSLVLALLISLMLPGASGASGTPHAAADSNAAAPADFSCGAVTEIPVAECEDLVALYDSTNGPEWGNKTGWLQTNTPCSWYGLSCSNGRVGSLSLSNNHLTGAIPIELGGLANLQRLSLDYNQLTGAIPPELGNLANLERLYVGRNQLTGRIPPELGSLANLQSLSLEDNQLTGAIPPGLGNLANLEFLYLGDNQLTGGVPPELGNLANLYHLVLHRNQLTGAIPPELGNLAKLVVLDLHRNHLTGAIPPELGNLAILGLLWLYGNQLTGAIPPELGDLAGLRELFLHDNQLTGSIPPELGSLANLQSLHLEWNQLTGAIPPELGNLGKLSRLYLNNNQLTGALPATLTALSLLYFWYDATDLCEPGASAFQAWLGGISDLRRTDVLCGDRRVSGIVWNDLDRDGIRAPGEPPLPGVTVTLSREAEALTAIAAGRQMVTGSDGGYRFGNVATGAYLVAAARPGCTPTVPVPVSIVVPEGSDVTVPPIGMIWEGVRLFLPLVRR